MQLKLLQPQDSARWDAFVSQHSAGSFFHLSGWRKVIQDAYQHTCWYYYVESQGQIVAVLPLAQIKSWLFGNKLISLPFAVSAGLLSENEQASQLLLTHAQKLARDLKVDSLELRHRELKLPHWQSRHSHDNFCKSLADDSDAILAAIKKKQRAVVRQSLKNDLTFSIEDKVEPFFTIYSESVRNLGTPVFPKKYFQTLLQVFPNQVDVLTVYHQGEAVSSVMSFYFKQQVLPFYGGGKRQARGLKSNDFMYYQLMCHARRRGMLEFDFGRSKVASGAHAYKKHWGFEPQPLFYENDLVASDELANINPNNPKYKFFIKVWQKLPLAVSQVVGPILAKDLG
ncbi:FemAB family XrtA/PEP-CTERM system-associated protein [Motilimonas pumila]|uniref:FemAB family PEP-CTERM system-associated protein n=1 Tax=Motilimonas pumila TaxID=2303987 RepID=A0A418YHC9_9GAMM|nr:FemAB family XrtA/PEP-CTERM system-associated protein [Motilimonas pumila]RJG49463.1 FemAB family PEP-CTERM system-associated protein [Motilimonas pumila]